MVIKPNISGEYPYYISYYYEFGSLKKLRLRNLKSKYKSRLELERTLKLCNEFFKRCKTQVVIVKYIKPFKSKIIKLIDYDTTK